ncbi:MAG: phosphoadenosine phosphosulfate reductase family protein [Thiomicrorhabdus sp.]|nr:phosphoadenosine phosphosulfate reductase family protein [Thiomicrorhabdus sp.]
MNIEDLLLDKGVNFKSDRPLTSIKCIVPTSGGKDSQTCLELAVKEYGANSVISLFCDTEYEHPNTYKHIRQVTSALGVNLVTINAGSVEGICINRGRFPRGGARHCTNELKIRPSKFFYKFFSLEFGGFQVWYGMRTGESGERAKRYDNVIDNELYLPNEIMRNYPKYLGKQGVTFRLPIVDWTDEQVFSFLNGRENVMYYFGFDRVGCFPCLAGGEKLMMKAFEYDEIGSKHYEIAVNISKETGKPVFETKKLAGQVPACAICSI